VGPGGGGSRGANGRRRWRQGATGWAAVEARGGDGSGGGGGGPVGSWRGGFLFFLSESDWLVGTLSGPKAVHFAVCLTC
jgi:hypothetical protein